MQPLFQWFESTAIGTTVRESLWMFPVIECIHLLALALLGGAVLLVDLRLLGFGLRSQRANELARHVQPWFIGALIAIVATGIPMFLSEAIKCYFSPPFFYKMTFLLFAILFTFTIRHRVVNSPHSPLQQRLTAAVSLSLWFGVGFSGRWIAFY
jgi:hypothetical protein